MTIKTVTLSPAEQMREAAALVEADRMSNIDISSGAVERRVAHLRHVYGPDDPDAALIEKLSSALRLPPEPAVRVTVKDLVWEDSDNRFAGNPWGGYYICDRSGPNDDWDWFGWVQSSRGDCDESADDFPTLEAAKAAAQADYEARILSALDTAPEPACGGAGGGVDDCCQQAAPAVRGI